MPNYGVIDLGSNTIRLCVYEVKDDTLPDYRKKDFRSLLNNKAMAGLSSHIEQGAFTERGIDRAVDVLRGHHKRLKYFNCVRVDVFATAVLRSCSNSDQVIGAIFERTGFPITVLSAEEEAYLGFMGASRETPLREGTLIDIGGGSTEITAIADGIPRDPTSLAQGSLSSYVNHVKSILPTPRETKAIRASIREKLNALPSRDSYSHELLYGIGGSLRAATKLYAALCAEGVRPDTLDAGQFDDMLSLLADDPDAFAHATLKIVPERIHTLVPGCIIAREVMDAFGSKTLTLCSSGVREGYLIERMLLR